MPIPKLFGTDEFAQLVGLDDRSVRRLVKQGILTRDEKGFPPAAIEQYIAHRERAAEERAGGGAYGKARAELVTEQARKAKHAREVQEGA
jgi:hypothetical protein